MSYLSLPPQSEVSRRYTAGSARSRWAGPVAALALCLLSVPAAAHQSQAAGVGETRAGTWRQDRVPVHAGQPSLALQESGAAARGGGPGESASSSIAEVVSPPLEAPYAFNAVGFHWEGELPDAAALAIEARASRDGNDWTVWLPVDDLDALEGSSAPAQDSDLLFLEGRYLQYRLTITGLPPGWQGTLDQVQITYIDSSSGPTAEAAAAAGGAGARLSAAMPPPIITRAAWGANEQYRTWAPRYAPVKKIIVHHTATTSNPSDPAAAIRAIYYYHAVTQHWGDIGYNYLIDQAGRVYQGRFGGSGVIGAHALQYNPGSIGVALLGTFTAAAPSDAALQALQDFLQAQAQANGIDPLGHGFFVDRDLPNIMAHRDAIPTACPGDQLYKRLPDLKARIASSQPLSPPPLREAWMQDTIPATLNAGLSTSVSVTVTNTGAAGWSPWVANPIRLGYQWLTSDGAHYTEPGLELRTPLPRVVYPGQSITLTAALRVPAEPGTYLLVWDLVQENITWFGEQGNPTFQKQVTVSKASSQPATSSQPASSPQPASTPPPPLTALLAQPVPNALVSLGPLFTWKNPPGTTQYQIQVIPFENDGPGINLIRNAETSYQIVEPLLGSGNYILLPGMTYTWQVRTTTATEPLGEDDPGWGPWVSSTFQTQPTSSLLLSPASPWPGTTTADLTPVLVWTNRVQHIFYYEVQVSSDPDFGSNAFLYWETVHGGMTTPLNSYHIPPQFPLQPGTTYYWRVRPRVQGDGVPLPWSQAWSFTTPSDSGSQ